MPYVKEPVPVGASLEALVRYYDLELSKLQIEHRKVDAMLEAVDIIGVASVWFWDDQTGLGEPPPGHMRANTNVMATFTVMNFNYENAAGKRVDDLLKTSSIDLGFKFGLVNTSGLGSGVYDITADHILNVNHFSVQVTNFEGQSGNPQVDDIMQARWDFNVFEPQDII